MTLSEILKKNSALFGGADQNYGIKKYTFPGSTDTYSAGGSSPAVIPQSSPLPILEQKPVYPTPTGKAPVVTPPVVKKQTTPIFSGATPTTQPTSTTLDYSKYTNPETGKPYSPKEYADIMATKAQGGVQSYASGAIANPDQSIEQLRRNATELNNAANDIATGTTDPYGVISKSGVAFSPTERKAIQSAYAGIYDPALSDVFTKIDTKQKEAASALDLKNELAKLDQQHKFSMQEKSAPTYADLHPAGGIGSGTGTYILGANPAVDAWAQGIVDGSRKITDIPASQKGMRDAVQLAVVSGGNQMNGKPTTTELGKAALANAKALMTKVDAGTGMGAVGASRLWGAGAIGGAMPGTPAYGLSNDFNAIKSQLSLDAVKYLKGQGQVSDAERALLAQAATKLNLSQSESEFKQTLQNIINKLETGNIEGTDTSGFSQPQTMILNGQTLNLQADGTYE